jgi:hypothetical protein
MGAGVHDRTIQESTLRHVESECVFVSSGDRMCPSGPNKVRPGDDEQGDDVLGTLMAECAQSGGGVDANMVEMSPTIRYAGDHSEKRRSKILLGPCACAFSSSFPVSSVPLCRDISPSPTLPRPQSPLSRSCPTPSKAFCQGGTAFFFLSIFIF